MEALLTWNTHWSGGPITPRILKHETERAVVPHWVQELIAPPEATWALKVGPRQVGKTTSLGHVGRRLIAEHDVRPARVTFVSLDDEAVLAESEGRLDRIFEAVSVRQAPTRAEPAFLLLDEIQALPDWARQLKSAWDRFHLDHRVLATGSSAFRIGRSGQADFPGRIRTVAVHPMKFREVLDGHPDLSLHIDREGFRLINAEARACREALMEGHVAFGKALERLHESLHARGLAKFLRQVFLEYCAWGGYPTLRPGSTLTPVERLDRLESALNTVIARDAVPAGLRKVREFRILFRQIALNPGGKFEPFGMGNRIDVPGQTVRDWKALLDNVMLVQQLQPLKPSLAPMTGRDKAYPLDPAWWSLFRGNIDLTAAGSGPVLGLLVESVIVDHGRRLQFNLLGTTALPVGYIESPEVDLAVALGKRWLLVEAKHRARPRGRLHEVGGKEDVRVLVTRDDFGVGDRDRPHAVPAHEFAFLC